MVTGFERPTTPNSCGSPGPRPCLVHMAQSWSKLSPLSSSSPEALRLQGLSKPCLARGHLQVAPRKDGPGRHMESWLNPFRGRADVKGQADIFWTRFLISRAAGCSWVLGLYKVSMCPREWLGEGPCAHGSLSPCGGFDLPGCSLPVSMVLTAPGARSRPEGLGVGPGHVSAWEE